MKGGFGPLTCLRDTLSGLSGLKELSLCKIMLLLDNNGAILHITKSSSDSVMFANKAINVRHGLMRDVFKAGVFTVGKIPTDENRGDVGTKNFGPATIENKTQLVGLHDPTGCLWHPATRAIAWKSKSPDALALCVILGRSMHLPGEMKIYLH